MTEKYIQQTALGERYFDNGGVLVTSSTGSVTGRFWRLLALTDVTIATATTPDLTGSLNGQSISAGVELRVCFRQIELTSGTALLSN